jgi:iron complex outermembrane receptor protein
MGHRYVATTGSPMKRTTVGTIAILVGVVGAAAMAEDKDDSKPEIRVEAAAPVEPTKATVKGVEQSRPLADDGAEVLLDTPGVNASRLGGHGLEPFIRGQSQNRINVLLDGANVYGACPNRMDPPSSYAAPGMYDRITVIKGVTEGLAYGAGATGGTVLYQREAPGFTESGQTQGKAALGYRSNGDIKTILADYARGGPTGYVRVLGEGQDAGNYVDGSGAEVRSSFRTANLATIFGYSPDSASNLEFDVEAARAADVLYAGAGMDTPESRNDILQLKYDREIHGSWIRKMSAHGSYSTVHHLMNNYSLRTTMPTMWMEVPADSRTYNLKLAADLVSSGTSEWSAGIEQRYNNREAIRYSGATLSTINSIMWPDVSVGETGVYATYKNRLGERNRVLFGGRIDSVSADAAQADGATGGPPNPNALYNLYYGISAKPVSEINPSVSARYEHDAAGSPATWFVSFGRISRTADATERFMAANGMTPDMRWVGNPGILPEKHNELSVGLMRRISHGSLGGSVFYNRVADYILRDRAHGQPGILQTDSAFIYRNVEAELYGGEFEFNQNWSRRLSSRLTAAYVVGTNLTDNRPIAQIPPLEMTASLDYRGTAWKFGGKARVVAAQNRVDDDPATGSGLDLGPSQAFSLLDLYAHRELSRRARLSFGVDNVFNVTYAEHLNRYNPMDPVPMKVNEPGRSIWIKALMEL